MESYCRCMNYELATAVRNTAHGEQQSEQNERTYERAERSIRKAPEYSDSNSVLCDLWFIYEFIFHEASGKMGNLSQPQRCNQRGWNTIWWLTLLTFTSAMLSEKKRTRQNSSSDFQHIDLPLCVCRLTDILPPLQTTMISNGKKDILWQRRQPNFQFKLIAAGNVVSCTVCQTNFSFQGAKMM